MTRPSYLDLALATLSRCVPGADTTGFSLDLTVLPDGTVGVTERGQARAQHLNIYAARDGLRSAVNKGYALLLEGGIYIPSESFCKQIQAAISKKEAEFQQFLKWERGEVDTWQLPTEGGAK